MLQIRKLSTKTWKHVDSIDGAFILTKFYAKEEFNEFLIVESYGAKRRKYLINEIEVYDIGGTAETFANFEDLFLRLEALKYTGFYKDGDVDLTPVYNAINSKLDKSSTPSSVYTTDSGGLQVMKPISEFQTDISGKLDKVTTAGVERVYTINADGSQGTKATSDFKEVIEGYFNGTNFYTDALFTNLITPESGKIYLNIAVTPATQYRWSGSAYVQIGGGGSWGSITGNLSDQTDLQNALDTKQDKPTYVINNNLSGTHPIDFNVDTHRLTLIGNTTFTEINLPAIGFSKTITLHINGNFGIVLPASWTTFISGSYNGTATLNTIVIETIGNERKVQISQPG